MGFLKDLNKLNQQAKEIKKDWDPGQQMRDATTRMQQMNEQFAAANAAGAPPPEDAVDASASVVSVGMTSGMMNMDPILPVELLVNMPGRPPTPVSATLVVPMAHLAKVSAGATLPVRVSASNPNAVFVNWAAVG